MFLLTQNLHTLKIAAVSIAIQGFYKLALLSGNKLKNTIKSIF